MKYCCASHVVPDRSMLEMVKIRFLDAPDGSRRKLLVLLLGLVRSIRYICTDKAHGR